MANMSVPFDGPAPGRRQYSFVDIAMAHAVTGVGLGSFQQISPTAYVLANSWPQPKASGGSSFSGLAASQAVPEVAAPRSSAGALALWPNLK